MGYATVSDVEAGFRAFDADESAKANQLIEEASIIVDAYNENASEDRKRLVVCHMVRRAIGDGMSGSDIPMGATTGSMSALGYSQSWTLSNGSVGELYLGKIDKKLLGVGNRIGCGSILEDMV